LEEGGEIEVRVRGGEGFSEVATPTPRLSSVPPKAHPPRLVAINETAAVVEWDKVSEHFSYELYWNDH